MPQVVEASPLREASELIKELVERGVLKEVRDGKEKFVELVNR